MAEMVEEKQRSAQNQVLESRAGDSAPRRRRVRRWLTEAAVIVLDLVLALVVVGSVVQLTGIATGRWRSAVVLSGSMRPKIEPGDVELLFPERPSQVKVGQVLALRPPGGSFTYTHRVVKVEHRGSAVLVETKGDANDAPDPWGLVRITSAKAWKVGYVIPKVGWAATVLRGGVWKVLVIVGVVLALMYWLLKLIWATPTRRPKPTSGSQ